MKYLKGSKVGNWQLADGKKYKFAILATLLMLVGSWLSVNAQNFPPQPNPPRLVNDFAGVLSAAEQQSLERKLVAYDDSTSTQIAIVIIESLEGAEIGSYAAELGEKWGVGGKQNHNGVMILMAKQERKITIRTGYGVEEKLGAIITDRIIKGTLIPNFKQGNFYVGFDEATDEIMGRLSGMYVGNGKKRDRDNIPVWVILIILFIIFFILPMLLRNKGGTTYSRRGLNTWGGGLGGFGGFGGGGFGGGGSSSGGGFGGFGGGGFSGGGSSGSW